MKGYTLVSPSEIFCIDPALLTVETEAFDEISELAPFFSFSYHLPAKKGMASLYKREKEVSIKAIIIFGSVASPNDSEPWQKELHPWVLKKMKEGIPTLGICYGHQMIASVFGGKVGFLNKDKSKFFGYRSFDVLKNCPLELPSSRLSVVASHCEEVKELPQCLEVCARSKSVPVEGFFHKELPVIAFQTHPEAREAFCNRVGVTLREGEDHFWAGKLIMKSFIDYVKRSQPQR